MPKRKTVKFIKDRMEVLLFAKPFRDLVPECGPRDPGSKWRLAELDATGRRKDAGKPRDTQSLVLDCEVYIRTRRNVQGGIKGVT